MITRKPPETLAKLLSFSTGSKRFFIQALLYVVASFGLFHSLLVNLQTHLFDWNDYGLFVWILYQNIFHFRTGSWIEIFNGNAFHPNQGVLLFSDLFWPQSLLGWFFSFFTSNPVLVFNLVFFFTHLLNILAAQYFWRSFFRQSWLVFLASFFTVFSPFMLSNSAHFQIFTIWPFFLTLGWFFQRAWTFRNGLVLGVLLFIQLVSGVYFAIFLLSAFALIYVARIAIFRTGVLFRQILMHALGWGGSFVVLGGPVLWRYIHIKDLYNITRHYHEYVIYSSHITDYFFPVFSSSVLWQLPLLQQFVRLNGHAGLFPGFILLALMLYFFIRRIRKWQIAQWNPTYLEIIFLSFIVLGGVFSLGPRLNLNGEYIGTPLPYALVLKLNPFFEIIRVTSRWALFVYIGIIYFSVRGMNELWQKYAKYRIWLLLAVLVLFVIETFPSFGYRTEQKEYYPAVYEVLAYECNQDPQVLLEYPMTEYMDGSNIVSNLSYRTQMMMATIHHGCHLVNGYTGYIPEEYERFEQQLFESVENDRPEEFFTLLARKDIKMLKLNKSHLYSDRVARVMSWLQNQEIATVVIDTPEFVVAEIK